jgi:hypothetical protein
MSRLLVAICSVIGGLLVGAVGGRSTSSVTFGDVKAAPGKTFSTFSGFVKKAGKKVSSGISSLAFWQKKEEPVKKEEVDFEMKYQEVSEKYAILSDDFSTAVKEKDILATRLSDAETKLKDSERKLGEEEKKNLAYQNTVADNDKELTKAINEKKAAEAELKTAKTTITKMKKSDSEAE